MMAPIVQTGLLLGWVCLVNYILSRSWSRRRVVAGARSETGTGTGTGKETGVSYQNNGRGRKLAAIIQTGLLLGWVLNIKSVNNLWWILGTKLVLLVDF